MWPNRESVPQSHAERRRLRRRPEHPSRKRDSGPHCRKKELSTILLFLSAREGGAESGVKGATWVVRYICGARRSNLPVFTHLRPPLLLPTMADQPETSGTRESSPDNTGTEPPVLGIKRTLTIHSDTSNGSGSIVPDDSVSQRGFRSLANSIDSGRFALLRRRTGEQDPRELDNVPESEEEPDVSDEGLGTLDAEPDESHLPPRQRGRMYWWRDGRRWSSSAADTDSEDATSSDGGNGDEALDRDEEEPGQDRSTVPSPSREETTVSSSE